MSLEPPGGGNGCRIRAAIKSGSARGLSRRARQNRFLRLMLEDNENRRGLLRLQTAPQLEGQFRPLLSPTGGTGEEEYKAKGSLKVRQKSLTPLIASSRISPHRAV